MANTTDAGTVARIGITGALLLLSAWWLWVVSNNLGAEPKLSSDGKIIFDKFQRSKDVLLVVLPLLTLALGYWYGTQGTAKAEENAEKAVEKADQAEAKADQKAQQLEATLSVGADDLLARARAANPSAFGE